VAAVPSGLSPTALIIIIIIIIIIITVKLKYIYSRVDVSMFLNISEIFILWPLNLFYAGNLGLYNIKTSSMG
jgi:hypothetical protein